MSAELQVMSIFPSPLGICNFGEESRDLNKQLIEDIKTERKLDKEGEKRTFSVIEGTWQSRRGLETTYSSFDLLRDAILAALIKTLPQTGYANEYINDKHLDMGGLWANVIFKRGGFSIPHIHGTGITLWSGVYYPAGYDDPKNLDDFNINDVMLAKAKAMGDGWLGIIDPAKVQKNQCRPYDTYVEVYPYYGCNLFVKPREGLLILFPAWLEHWVTPTTTDKKRYSISFQLNKKPLVKGE